MPHDYLMIASLGLVIFIIRCSGFWLAGFVRYGPRLKNALESLPGCILLGLVIPMLSSQTVYDKLACIVIILVMIKTKNVFQAMLAGIVLHLLLC